MKPLTFSYLADFLGVQWNGAACVVEGISIDTRTLNANDVFLAFKGPHFDGHDFIDEAIAKGARGLIVSHPGDWPLPCLVVENTEKALGQIAAVKRSFYDLPVFGVTGSCGKTTTKSILANILAKKGKTLMPQASFNNHVGVPLTLMELTEATEYAVIEMGANHRGEIAYLANIVKPTVSVVTTIAEVHLEGFGSIENIVREKGEIYNGLVPGGTAVINLDIPYAKTFQNVAKGHWQVTFGAHPHSDVRADSIREEADGTTRFRLRIGSDCDWVDLKLLGRHQVTNALAAAACAHAANIDFATIHQGLQTLLPVSGRLVKRRGLRNAVVIDDSYNANPEAVKAALQVLAKAPHETVFVFADMAELGEKAAAYHEEIGAKAREMQIKHLFTTGELAKHTSLAFGDRAQHFPNREMLAEHLKNFLQENMTVLVKASRGAGLESVVKEIVENG